VAAVFSENIREGSSVMALTINNNIASLQTDRQLTKRSSELKKNFEALASGTRINRASDDPAGLAVALDLLSNAQVSDVGQRNISDAVSAADIADGAISSAAEITGRLSELASQASNGTLSDQQRSALNSEYQALVGELDRIAQTTEFNGISLLSGGGSVTVQAGSDGSSSSQLGVPFPGVSASSLGLSSSIATQNGALQAIDEAKRATESLAASRGEIGATVSRLEVASENLRASSVNEREAASQIYDADIAAESARLVSNRIGQQAGVAIKAQANILPQLALKLLQ
jgi:flagellin